MTKVDTLIRKLFKIKATPDFIEDFMVTVFIYKIKQSFTVFSLVVFEALLITDASVNGWIVVGCSVIIMCVYAYIQHKKLINKFEQYKQICERKNAKFEKLN